MKDNIIYLILGLVVGLMLLSIAFGLKTKTIIIVIIGEERRQNVLVTERKGCTYTNISGSTTTVFDLDELLDKTRFRSDGCK